MDGCWNRDRGPVRSAPDRARPSLMRSPTAHCRKVATAATTLVKKSKVASVTSWWTRLGYYWLSRRPLPACRTAMVLPMSWRRHAARVVPSKGSTSMGPKAGSAPEQSSKLTASGRGRAPTRQPLDRHPARSAAVALAGARQRLRRPCQTLGCQVDPCLERALASHGVRCPSSAPLFKEGRAHATQGSCRRGGEVAAGRHARYARLDGAAAIGNDRHRLPTHGGVAPPSAQLTIERA